MDRVRFLKNGGLAAGIVWAAVATAQAPTQDVKKEAEGKPQDLTVKGQTTWIQQQLFPFHSPYQGRNSFLSRSEGAMSQTFSLFVGKRITPRLEAYIDPEDARGVGLSGALGTAGYPSAEVIRQGINVDPYVARAFLRYSVPVGNATEKVEEGQNQLAGDRATHRLVISAGKMATTDFFDLNAYADSARTQFMNWDFVNDTAYDYAADTRGYSVGVVAEYITPNWSLRAGSLQMPTQANGPVLDADIRSARGDQIELETRPHILKGHGTATWRFLGYRNVADMGTYDDALAVAKQSGSPPDITATRRVGTPKYGFATSFDQPLGDDGATGVFFRAGWNDDRTESFAYSEVGSSISAGLQISGARWKAKNDLFAIAVCSNDLSSSHRAYLAAGGYGFQVGDGKLSYGSERLLETYYNHSVNKSTTVGLDFELIQNPGYNRDRGPVPIASLRVHLEF